jgi:hypothetical protein
MIPKIAAWKSGILVINFRFYSLSASLRQIQFLFLAPISYMPCNVCDMRDMPPLAMICGKVHGESRPALT